MVTLPRPVNSIFLSGPSNCSYANVGGAPEGVVVDPSNGALFVANQDNGALCRVPPGGGSYACVFNRGCDLLEALMFKQHDATGATSTFQYSCILSTIINAGIVLFIEVVAVPG